MAAKQVFEALAEALRQLSQAREDLKYAQETIFVLQAELEAGKRHADDVHRRMTKEAVSGSVLPASGPHVTIVSQRVWVDDLWLCFSEDFAMVHEAERLWQEGKPQQALNTLSALEHGASLTTHEYIQCKMLESALLLSNSLFEPSLRRVDEILRLCDQRTDITDLPLRLQLSGIAHYLRGRAFLEREKYDKAYWDLNKAVVTKFYHEKIVDLKDIAEAKMNQSNTRM